MRAGCSSDKLRIPARRHVTVGQTLLGLLSRPATLTDKMRAAGPGVAIRQGGKDHGDENCDMRVWAAKCEVHGRAREGRVVSLFAMPEANRQHIRNCRVLRSQPNSNARKFSNVSPRFRQRLCRQLPLLPRLWVHRFLGTRAQARCVWRSGRLLRRPRFPGAHTFGP